MDEKTKNILSYILSILFVGSIVTCLVINPYVCLMSCFFTILAIFGLFFLIYIVKCVKKQIYDFFSSNYFQKNYRKYIYKHYDSREQLFYERGDEICAKCDRDCVVKHPIRRYNEDSHCKERIDIFIKENGLNIDDSLYYYYKH